MTQWLTVPLATGSRPLRHAPDAPGCYVIAYQGRVIYVGVSQNVRIRLRAHLQKLTPGVLFSRRLGRLDMRALVVRVKVGRPYGEWLMTEARLIRRLNPPGNVSSEFGLNTSRARIYAIAGDIAC